MEILTPTQMRQRALAQGAAATAANPRYAKPPSTGTSGPGFTVLSDPEQKQGADLRRRLNNPNPTWYDDYQVERASFSPGSNMAEDLNFWRKLQNEASTLWESRSAEDLKEVDNAFYAGAGGTLTSSAAFTSRALEWAARKTGADTMADVAALTAQWADAGTRYFEKYQPQDPGLWSKLASAAGSSAAMIVPSLMMGPGVGGIATLAAKVGGASLRGGAVGATMKMVTSTLGKAGVAGYIEASAEAGGVYNQSVQRGDDPEQAFVNGAKILLPVMAMSMASNYIGFSKYGRLVRVPGEGVANAFEEMTTGHLGDWALGDKELTDFNDYVIEYFEEGFIGSVIGGISAAATPAHKPGATATPPHKPGVAGTGGNTGAGNTGGAGAATTPGAQLHPPSRPKGAPAAAASPLAGLQGDLAQYSQEAQIEADALPRNQLEEIHNVFAERHAKGEQLSTEEGIQWAVVQDTMWRKDLMQKLQVYTDADLLQAVSHTLDNTTPSSLHRDARTMLDVAMREIDNRGIANQDVLDKYTAWNDGANNRAQQMGEVKGEPEHVPVTVEVTQNNPYFPADGFTATVTQPDGAKEDFQFPTRSAAETFKSDRERIGRVKPGKTSRVGPVEGPETAPRNQEFTINIDQNNPYFPADGFTVTIKDPGGVQSSYHFTTEAEANTFAQLKYDALTLELAQLSEADRLMNQVARGERTPTIDELLDNAELAASRSPEAKRSLGKALWHIFGNKEAVLRKLEQLEGFGALAEQMRGESDGALVDPVSPDEVRTKYDAMLNRARVEVAREEFGDVVAKDVEDFLARAAAEETKDLDAVKKKAVELAKAAQTEKDQAEVEALLGDLSAADRSEVEQLLAENQTAAKEKAAADKQAKGDKSAVDKLLGQAGTDAAKTKASTEMDTAEAKEAIKAAGLSFGKFRLTGPKPARMLKGKGRQAVYTRAGVEAWIKKQKGDDSPPAVPAEAPSPEPVAPAAETPVAEPKKAAKEKPAKTKKAGKAKPVDPNEEPPYLAEELDNDPRFEKPKDSTVFDVGTRAQKNHVDTLAEVDAKLSEDLLARRPVSRSRLERGVSGLKDLAGRKMEDWIAYTKQYGMPKDNLGQPMLVPPEVRAIERAVNQLNTQLENLDAGRAAWDPGPRAVPSIRESGQEGSAIADIMRKKAPDLWAKIQNDEILTKPEQVRFRRIANNALRDERAKVDKTPTSKGRRRAAWGRMERMRQDFGRVKAQAAAVNFNAARAERIAREAKLRKGAKGDTTLGIGLGGLQPAYDALSKNVRGFLNHVLRRQGGHQWSAGMQALIDKHAVGRKKQSAGDTVRSIFETFRVHWLDDLQLAKDAIDEGTEGMYVRGRRVSNEEDLRAVGHSPYATLRGLVRGSGALAEQFLRHGATSFVDGAQKLTPYSLDKVLQSFKSIHKNYEAFGQYLRSRMILEWEFAHPDEFTVPPLPVSPTASQQAAHAAQVTKVLAAQQGAAAAHKVVNEAHVTFPEWNTAINQLDSIARALLEYAVQVGVYTPADVARISGKYRVFVPMWAAEDKRGQVARSKKGQGAPRPTKEYRHYEPDAVTMHPVEALGLSHLTTLSALHSNYARIQLANLIRMGATFGTILDPKARRTAIFVSARAAYAPAKAELVKRVSAALDAAGVGRKEKAKILRELSVNRITDAQVKLWVADMRLGEGVVTFLEGGKLQFMQVDPAIADAFTAMSRGNADFLLRTGAKFAGYTRTAVTLTLEFLSRNPMRDIPTAMFISRENLHGPRDIAWFLTQWWKSAFDVARQTEIFRQMQSAGGGQAGFHHYDLPDLSSRMRHEIETGGKMGMATFMFTHPIEALRFISGVTENATRLNVFKLVLKDLERTGNYTDFNARIVAGMAARERSIDFQLAGDYGRITNMFIPFFNAEIQGWALLAKSAKKDPKGFVGWGAAMITLPTIALWLANNLDDDRRKRWEAEPDWIKHNYWVMYPTADTKITIPKPFEIGILFGSLTERTLDLAFKGDTNGMKKFAEHFSTTNVPANPRDVLRAANFFGPLGAAWNSVDSNFDPFRRAPIVPAQLQKRRPVNQYNENTSELAVWLARRFDDIANEKGSVGTKLSPMMIDYFVRANLGSGPRAIHDAVRWAGRKALGAEDHVQQPEWYYRAPGIRAFLKEDPGAYDGNMERFFDLYNSAEAATNSFNSFAGSGDLELTAREMKLVGDLIAVHGQLQPAADMISEISKAIHLIERSEAGNPETRREQIVQLRKDRSDIARMMLEQIDLDAANDLAQEAAKNLERMHQENKAQRARPVPGNVRKRLK